MRCAMKIITSIFAKSFVITILCVSAISIISCATKTYQPKKDHTPQVASERMGKPAQPLEKKIEEIDLTAEKKVEESQLADVKEEKTEQAVRSEIRTFESPPIYFDFDSAVLTADARTILTNLAAWLQKNPEYLLEIEGHSDERGSAGYNLVLGETRAAAAKKYLLVLSIGTERISTVSYGEERPVDPAKTEAAWAKNRRCEFHIIRNL